MNLLGIESLKVISSIKITESDLMSYEDIFRGECERVKMVFRDAFLSKVDKDYLSRYFKLHEQSLIDLVDSILKEKSALINSENNIRLFKFLSDSVEDLLFFIEAYFTEFFNSDARAPHGYKTGKLHDISEANGILLPVVDLAKIDIGLKEIIYFLLKSNVVEGKNLTYNRLRYLDNLQSELLQINYDSNPEILNHGVISLLIKVNYNTRSFFDYVVRKILESPDSVDTMSSKLDRFSFWSKTISQIIVFPNMAYAPMMLSIRDQLLNWIGHEVSYLDQIRIGTMLNDQIHSTTQFKLRLSLPVGQIAYLFKLFMEVNVINNTNTSELIRFFVKYFSAKKLESFSYESFRVRFYNAEDGTKDAVKKLLQKLIDHINKDWTAV